MAMIIDLILKPYAERNGGKLFLWMDNCGLHTTPCLENVYRQASTSLGLLPNMTSTLQVLDLVVNGPMKAHIRNLRAGRLGDYFSDFKSVYEVEREKPVDQQELPKWAPPKPSLHECITDIINLVASGSFCTEKFKANIARTFISTGTCFDENGNFAVYHQIAGTGAVAGGKFELLEGIFFCWREI